MRRQSRGREVLYLDYEAYTEMAEEVIAKLAAELDEAHDSVGSRSTTGSAVSRSVSRAW